jgi:hypothetical protein
VRRRGCHYTVRLQVVWQVVGLGKRLARMPVPVPLAVHDDAEQQHADREAIFTFGRGWIALAGLDDDEGDGSCRRSVPR